MFLREGAWGVRVRGGEGKRAQPYPLRPKQPCGKKGQQRAVAPPR